MQKQGFEEPTGIAKITRAYNLPSKFVLHTVGPIVRGQVTDQNRADLANAYTSCLEVCKAIDAIRSIAFCCISTGIFGYPQDLAAALAVREVGECLKENAGLKVIFNVYLDEDRKLYEQELSR